MKSVIFDMDGILINSEDVYKRIETIILKDLNIKLDSEMRRSFVGSKTQANWKRVKLFLKLDFSVDEIVEREESMYLKCVENGEVEMFDDAYELMQRLNSNGYNIGIGTSSHKDIAHKLISKFGFDKFIKTLITCDDVISSKPEPDIYLKVAKSMSVSADDCIVIEDSYVGICSAKSANMKCIAKKNIHNDNYCGSDLIVADLYEVTASVLGNL